MGTILEALKELNRINESKDDRKRFINKFGKKIDNILIEDLDTMLKYYNNLQDWDKQELLNFLTKDPTWNSNKEQGQYSKWILDKLNRNLLNSSNLGHLHDVLKRFEDNKKYLKDKDINKFKSIQEIDTYLNDDNNYNELSHSQVVRQHRRDKQKVDLGNEAELVYEDSNWEIWIPKTYAASCKLGQGSKWCTASTETSEYFDDYSREGDLYIILNKHNEKEKYQFHFKSGSYMDINDEEIYLLDFIVDESNKKWITALRKRNRYFDKKCKDIFNKREKAIEELNDFLQKNKSIKSIKYPTQKDIIEGSKKFAYGGEHYEYITRQDLLELQDLKLEIENNVTEIEPFAFRGMDWITQVIFEKNSKLRCIRASAFSGCSSIVELDLPNSITSIREYAFNGCTSLESITIPNSVRWLLHEVFRYCTSLENVYYEGTLEELIVLLCNNGHSDLTKHASHIYTKDNIDFKSLTTITIPNSVTSISWYAFDGCTSLTNIIIPNSITRIERAAFKGCPNLVIKTANPYVIDYCIKNNIKYEKID